MPFLLSPAITSPAYMYVEEDVRVPPAPGLFWISQYLQELSVLQQFPGNPYRVSRAESLLPAVRAIASARPDVPSPRPPGSVPAHPEAPPYLGSCHSEA